MEGRGTIKGLSAGRGRKDNRHFGARRDSPQNAQPMMRCSRNAMLRRQIMTGTAARKTGHGEPKSALLFSSSSRCASCGFLASCLCDARQRNKRIRARQSRNAGVQNRIQTFSCQGCPGGTASTSASAARASRAWDRTSAPRSAARASAK